MSAIKGKWFPGVLCSTHGHIVGPGHSRKNFNKKPGRARQEATITMPYALILPLLAKTRTKIGINFCFDGGRAANDSLNLDFAVAANPIF